MLDDLRVVHERDPQDALGIAEKQWSQLEYKFEVSPRENKYTNVIFCGMGGSALAALVAQVWPGFSVPFEIVRDYKIPQYANQDSTLCIISSYSGNTEETVSALKHAEEKGLDIVIITSGGMLSEIAQQKEYPLLQLPSGLQPRHAVLYGLKALVTITDNYGLTDHATDMLASRTNFLRETTAQWVPTVPTSQNVAKQIALECIGNSVVVYGGPLMYPAAYKWKISFNENAKHVAWVNQYSEFNHNEFIGWTEQPVSKPYTVIDIRSNLEHPQILKRFEISAKLLSGKRPDPIVVNPNGDELIDQLLWSIALGDFVSIYTALLGNVNPTPVPLIEKLKKEL